MKIKKFIKKNILILSSLLFITNIINAYMYEEYIYAILFIFLTITSLFYHHNIKQKCKKKNIEEMTNTLTNYDIYTNIFDKIAISLIVFYGGYRLYNKSNNLTPFQYIGVILVFLLFFSTIMLYICGYYFRKFCFHKKKNIGNKYHSLLHSFSSIGHHLIIIL